MGDLLSKYIYEYTQWLYVYTLINICTHTHSYALLHLNICFERRKCLLYHINAQKKKNCSFLLSIIWWVYEMNKRIGRHLVAKKIPLPFISDVTSSFKLVLETKISETVSSSADQGKIQIIISTPFPMGREMFCSALKFRSWLFSLPVTDSSFSKITKSPVWLSLVSRARVLVIDRLLLVTQPGSRIASSGQLSDWENNRRYTKDLAKILEFNLNVFNLIKIGGNTAL